MLGVAWHDVTHSLLCVDLSAVVLCLCVLYGCRQGEALLLHTSSGGCALPIAVRDTEREGDDRLAGWLSGWREQERIDKALVRRWRRYVRDLSLQANRET